MIKANRCMMVCALMVCLKISVSADMIELVCYEGFDYSAGVSLTGQTGGDGWNGGWNSGYGGDLGILSPGYTYPDLAVQGNAAQFATGGAPGISEANRSLKAQNEGVVFVQCLFQSGSSGIGSGTPQLRLSLSGAGWTGGLGGNDGSVYVSILDSSVNPAGVSTAPLTDLNLLIYKIDYDAGESYLWTNPDLAGFDYLNPSTPDATASIAPQFDNVAIYFRSGASIDEIAVMNIVPEPGTLMFVTAGLLGLGLWRCKRKGPFNKE